MTSFRHITPRDTVVEENITLALRLLMENLFKFYFDFLSPISRPLWMLFEHAEVHCEKVQIALRKGMST